MTALCLERISLGARVILHVTVQHPPGHKLAAGESWPKLPANVELHGLRPAGSGGRALAARQTGTAPQIISRCR
ncbi:MAG: hypothetical protein U0893_04420 [Chloroflexota bacterium]